MVRLLAAVGFFTVVGLIAYLVQWSVDRVHGQHKYGNVFAYVFFGLIVLCGISASTFAIVDGQRFRPH